MAARRLAALMFTDMVGYSALAKRDEELARELVAEHRVIVRTILPLYGGQENDTTGDGFFVEFGSVIDAVECAIEIQTALHERGYRVPAERAIRIRIGIHLSDIITDDEDSFGNGVNIAARIEALSPSGGVCLTRQVFDQIDGKVPIEVRKVGQTPLKNIRGGAELYQLVFPWEQAEGSFLPRLVDSWQARFRRASVNSLLIGGLFVSCIAILAFSATLTWRGLSETKEDPSRSPASFRKVLKDSPPTPRRMDLSSGWTYALDTARRSPGDLPSPPDETWLSFDPHNSWKYAEAIQGRYWLKKTFEIRYPFQYPAMVLGLIADSHRVYLNGHFIGGSDQLGDLAYYVFDPSLLKLDSPNTLLVSARTRPTLDPGLTWLPEVGTFMGEFEDVRSTVLHNQISFHILRTVYLALSLAIFSACLGFALFRRSHRHYLYCSLFLLLGSIHLSYYNPWISSMLDYRVLRLLKLVSLTLAPFVLNSAYLHRRQRPSLEAVNNGAAVGAVMAATLILLGPAHTPASFIAAYNGLLAATSIYCLYWVSVALFRKIRESALRAKGLATSVGASSGFPLSLFEWLVIGFGALSFLTLVTGLKSGMSMTFFTPQTREWLQNAGMAMPFVFSLLVLTAATIDYTFQSRTAARKKSRDQLVLSLIRLIHGSTDVTETVGTIQERVSRFLKARRSTLYVLELEREHEQNTEALLKATYILGDEDARREVKKAIRLDNGLIGYACTHRSPLLIQDIRKDLRFAQEIAERDASELASYRSGTCMIFPLLCGERLVGVLTFADKDSEQPFTRDDFAMALEVSIDLALLLDNRQLQEALKKLS